MVALAAKTTRRFPLPPPASARTLCRRFLLRRDELSVEVDGGQHADDGEARTRWLEARGYRVIRFWNNDVLANTDGVLRMILDALRAAPHPSSPSRGEG